MTRVTNINKLVSVCGVILGLLIVYSIATPLIAEGSDVEGGWWISYQGDACNGNTTLYCPDGQESGVFSCGGTSFDGTYIAYPWNGKRVNILGSRSGCTTTQEPLSYLCSNVYDSECIYF